MPADSMCWKLGTEKMDFLEGCSNLVHAPNSRQLVPAAQARHQFGKLPHHGNPRSGVDFYSVCFVQSYKIGYLNDLDGW